MKIVMFEPKFLTPKHYSFSPLVFEKSLARILAQQGDEVFVLSQGVKQAETREGYTLLPLGGDIVPFHNLFPNMLESIPNMLPFFSPSVMTRAIKYIKQDIKPDVIYTANNIFPSVFSAILQQRTGVPAVYHVFFMPSQRWWNSASVEGYRIPRIYAARQGAKNALHEFIKPNFVSRWGLRNVTRVIASSSYLKQRLVKFGLKPDHISVVYPGVDIPPLDNLSAKGDPTAAYLGHLWQGRGVLDLADAFSQVCSSIPQARLMVAPTDVNAFTKKYFLEKIQKYSMEPNIVWKGIVNDVNAEIFGQADVITLPYRSDASIKLLEAMAAGKAVITSNIEWITEVVTDGKDGYIIRPGDSGNLAIKLRTLLNNRELSIQIGRQARQTIMQKYSLEIAANAVRRILLVSTGEKQK